MYECMEPNRFVFVEGPRGTLLDGSKIMTLLCVIASMNNMLCVEYHVSIYYLMY